jgi:LPXTG-site transpeptidase (sortase) family protein
MTRSEEIKFLIVRTIGNFLVLFALFGVFATFGPALYYEAQYRMMQIRGVSVTVEEKANNDSAEIGFADILSGPKEQILTPSDPVFSILIPKIGASAKVFPNIDASNPDKFIPVLKKGIAHARGTFFPGQKGNIYLFAHSADNFWSVGRYNATFYLLKDLDLGDDVVMFYQNKRRDYSIVSSKVVDPSEVHFVNNPDTGEENLILQTCWPPGTTWKRLIVTAEPK